MLLFLYWFSFLFVGIDTLWTLWKIFVAIVDENRAFTYSYIFLTTALANIVLAVAGKYLGIFQ